MDFGGVWNAAFVRDDASDFGFARHRDHEGTVGGIKRGVGNDGFEACEVVWVRLCVVADHGEQGVARKVAARFPAVEAVGVMGQQESAAGVVDVLFQHHWG